MSVLTHSSLHFFIHCWDIWHISRMDTNKCSNCKWARFAQGQWLSWTSQNFAMLYHLSEFPFLRLFALCLDSWVIVLRRSCYMSPPAGDIYRSWLRVYPSVRLAVRPSVRNASLVRAISLRILKVEFSIFFPKKHSNWSCATKKSNFGQKKTLLKFVFCPVHISVTIHCRITGFFCSVSQDVPIVQR